jgi:hypothetical protein
MRSIPDEGFAKVANKFIQVIKDVV